MIWLRRALAVPLIVIFVLIFIVALVLCHLSGTVGSAGFYNGQMRKGDVYNWTYDTLLPAILDETALESPTDFPLSTPEIKADILTVIEQTFPPVWLQGTFENTTAQVFPYVTGDKDSFKVTVRLKERVTPMIKGINSVADEHATVIYDYVTNDLLVPSLIDEVRQLVTLQSGINLTIDEVRACVRDVVRQEEAVLWFKDMTGRVGAYVKGDVADLNMTIDVTGVKSRAASAVNALVEQKLHDGFDSIQLTCSEAQFVNELIATPDALPSCKPAGYTYDQFKQALETVMGRTFAAAIEQEVIRRMPEQYVYDHAEVAEMLGEDAVDTLDDLREFIVDDSASITEQDVRDMLVDSDDTGIGSDSSRELEEFDRVRNTIHTVKILLWVLWIVAILLLVGIGFLCGRNWKSRLLWPLCVLLVTSLVFVIVVAVASTFVPDEIVPAPEGSDVTQVETVMNAKGDEIAHNAISTFVWELELKLIICIVVAALGIAAVIAWMIVDRRRHQESIQHDPGSPPP